MLNFNQKYPTGRFGNVQIWITAYDAAATPEFSDNEPLALDSIGGKVLFLDTGLLPYWNTAGRPSSPATGQAGFNTQTSALEIYNGSSWVSVTLS